MNDSAHQDIGPSHTIFSKADWYAGIILLHWELRPTFNQYIQHGRLLTKIELWKVVHEIQSSAMQTRIFLGRIGHLRK